MTYRNAKAQGFTLVEILIVVVILGILAAIVVPQFTSASESAQVSSMAATLQTVRSQLELYKVQHSGNYPALATLQTGTPDAWTGLTTQTAIDGSAGTDFGPYLQKAPMNPFTNGSDVAADNSADWQYTAATGAILAVVPGDTATALGLSTTDYVAAPDEE